MNPRKAPSLLYFLYSSLATIHTFIRSRITEQNDKVEWSHRIDQDKIYRTRKFYSLDDLRYQGKAWNKKSNDIFRFILKCKGPNEIETELKNEFIKIRDKQRLKVSHCLKVNIF